MQEGTELTKRPLNETTIIHLVRHGHVHNPDKILYGRLPRFRLSDKGRRQARAAGRFLSDQPVRGVFSSPMLRARQTAGEILTFFPDLTLRTSMWLNEVCTSYEGLPADQVDRRKGDIYTGSAACFEQPADIFERVKKFFTRMRTQFTGRHVVAVSHGDVITFSVLWAKRCELTPANKGRLHQAGYGASYPAHASITSLVFETPSEEERPVIYYHHPPDA